MDIKNYLDIVNMLEVNKRNTRHCYLSDGRHESVAEHSWRLAMMAYFLKDEFPEADINKVILMCTLHDLGEAFTGDVPCFLKTEVHEETEENALNAFLSKLPSPYDVELKELFGEMYALETIEAKIYKALDKLEAVIQHNQSDISTWLPLEYDLQLTHGAEAVQFSDYMKRLKEEIDSITREKIRREGNKN